MDNTQNGSEKLSFEEFQTQYDAKTVPDFSSLTTQQLFTRILQHEKEVHGIDWKAAHVDGSAGIQKAVAHYNTHLSTLISNLSDNELNTAKSLGIVNADNTPATFPDGAPSYPTWGWRQETVTAYGALRGDDVKKAVTNLVATFQVMAQDDDVGIVKTCMQAGIVGFGVAGLTAVATIIRTLAALTEATEAYAVLDGVLTVGVNVIKLAVSTVVLAILIPLMILMAKDAFGLFVIINNTASDLVMSGISYTHGKCVAGFKNTDDITNEQAIIPAVFEMYNPATQQTIKAISAGFLGARKRDNALIGTLGAMSFAPTTDYPTGIFLGWEVPLASGDNTLLVSANYSGDLSTFADKAQSADVLDSSDKSSTGATIEGHMNSASGSEAYAFFIAGLS